MRVALIAPTKMLPDLGNRVMQMALAHLVLEDPEYRRFYADAGSRGITVMMDNSLMELGDSVGSDVVFTAANLIEPAEIIIPDSSRNKALTIKRFHDFLGDVDAMGTTPWLRNAVVAHGESNAEWLACFDFFNEHPDAHVICIPKVLDKIWNPGGRLGALAYLRASHRFKINKTYHLLGIWTDPLEILFASWFNNIRSVDTALPIHAGLQGVQFGPMGLNGQAKPRRPHRYFPLEQFRHRDVIDYNIAVLDAWAEGRVWK